jgi:uncharacterized protein (DUF305 family)
MTPTTTRISAVRAALASTWCGLQSMIGHYQGAIEMAKPEIANGDNTDAIARADTIVATRQAEIDEMTKMLGG